MVAHEDVLRGRAFGERHDTAGAEIGGAAQIEDDRRKRNDVFGRRDRALRIFGDLVAACAIRRARTDPRLRARARPCARAHRSPRRYLRTACVRRCLRCRRCECARCSALRFRAARDRRSSRRAFCARRFCLRARVRRDACPRDGRPKTSAASARCVPMKCGSALCELLLPMRAASRRSQRFRPSRLASSSSVRARAAPHTPCADLRAAESAASLCRSRSAARRPLADRAFRDVRQRSYVAAVDAVDTPHARDDLRR